MSKKIFKDADYPIYEIMLEDDDSTGIRLVSLVKDPAIEIQGMAFSKEEQKNYEFKAIKDKQIIVGPAMIPDKKIPRKDEDGDPYYVFFSKDTIRCMVDKFNSENTGRSINIDHTNEMMPGFISENWIVEDPYYDKSRMYGYNLPVGTWFIVSKVEDTNFWNKEVKEAGRYSFSVEGLMSQRLSNNYSSIIDSLTEEEIIEILLGIGEKVSFDYDDTLSRKDIQEIASQRMSEGCDVYIITKNSKNDKVLNTAKELGIVPKNVIFTSGKPKWSFIKELGIKEHYDNNPDELKEIKDKTGIKVNKV